MNAFEVFYRIVVPIFLLIGTGTLMDRVFKLDLRTLSKLNFYVFVPALAFVSLLEADIGGDRMIRIALFAAIHVAVLFVLCRLFIARWESRETNLVLLLGTMFFNCGNYGFPLVILAFGREYLGIAAVVLLVQNLLSFTLGVWLFEKQSRGFLKTFIGLLRIPVIYAVSLPFLLRWLNRDVPGPLMDSFRFLGDGLIPVALLTLGAQLSRSFGIKNILSISTVTGMRLIVSPLVAAGILLVPFFALSVTDRAVLVAMAGLPVAVNVYILASQYEKGEELASQSVFWSTLLSAVTLSVLLTLYPG
jgi:predicted permease